MALMPPVIRPRADWAGDLPALWAIQPEEDVRFLLVHHTASANVGPESSVAQLRSFYGYHTSAEKGWPDIAYNFLVDSGGQIWEGRTGSLAGPVRGDATGGRQGHALLCCFIGDFTAIEPSPAATEAMTHLLAWLAQTYAVSLAEGAATTFVSRGSSRWPAGSTITTPTISGHRDMSQTSCPGDTAYAMLETTFRPGARSLLAAAGPSAGLSDSPSPEPTATDAVTPSPSDTPSATPSMSAAESGGASPSMSAVAAGAGQDAGLGWPLAAGLGGTAAVAALGWVLHRRMNPQGQHGPTGHHAKRAEP